MKNFGLMNEFNVIIGKNQPPAGVAEAIWQNDPNYFIFQNNLDDYAGITLAQVKCTNDNVCAIVAVRDRVPNAREPAAPHFASRVHQNSVTLNVHSTLEAYEEEHDGDGIVLTSACYKNILV
jgi:hypothetical protein